MLKSPSAPISFTTRDDAMLLWSPDPLLSRCRLIDVPMELAQRARRRLTSVVVGDPLRLTRSHYCDDDGGEIRHVGPAAVRAVGVGRVETAERDAVHIPEQRVHPRARDPRHGLTHPREVGGAADPARE